MVGRDFSSSNITLTLAATCCQDCEENSVGSEPPRYKRCVCCVVVSSLFTVPTKLTLNVVYCVAVLHIVFSAPFSVHVTYLRHDRYRYESTHSFVAQIPQISENASNSPMVRLVSFVSVHCVTVAD